MCPFGRILIEPSRLWKALSPSFAALSPWRALPAAPSPPPCARAPTLLIVQIQAKRGIAYAFELRRDASGLIVEASALYRTLAQTAVADSFAYFFLVLVAD